MKEIIINMLITRPEQRVNLNTDRLACEIFKGNWIVDWGDGTLELNYSHYN